MHFSLLLSFPIFLAAIASPVDQVESEPSSADVSGDTFYLKDPPSYDSLYSFNDVPAEAPGNLADSDSSYAFNGVPSDPSDDSGGSAIAVCDPQHESDSSLVPDSPDQQAWSDPNVLKRRQTIVDGLMGLVKPKSSTPSGTSCRIREAPNLDALPARQEKHYAPGYPDWAKKCEESDYFYALCCSGESFPVDKRSVRIASRKLNVANCRWGKSHSPLLLQH